MSAARSVVKASGKLGRRMRHRGWTQAQVAESVAGGAAYPATNLETGGGAKRYVRPITDRSVVIDDASGEVIHVGGDGFID